MKIEGSNNSVAGFMDSHLLDELLAKEHQAVGVANLIGGCAANVPSSVDVSNLGSTSLMRKDCDVIRF